MSENQSNTFLLPASPSRPLRLGVVGAGWVARACHLPSLEALRKQGWPVSVGAIADASATTAAAAVAVAPDLLRTALIFTKGETLLEEAHRLGLGAVLLLTPPHVTTRLLRSALAFGIPAFAEKPVAEEETTLASLIEASEEQNSIVQVGYNRRWQPFAPAFRDQVSRLRDQTATLHVAANLWRAARSEPIFYRDTMIHAVDFLQWCLGPLDVERITVWPPATPDGIVSGLHAELKTQGESKPATVHLDVRPAVGRSLESYLALGAKASAELICPPPGSEGSSASLCTWDADSGAGPTVEEVDTSPIGGVSGLWEQGFLSQMAGFVSLAGSVSTNENRASLKDALAARRLTDAILFGAAKLMPNP